MGNVKQEALRLIDSLPEEATWEDILYQIYVKKKIETGVKAADDGRVVPHEQVKEMFLRK